MGGTNCVGAKAKAVRLVEGNPKGCRGARGGLALRDPLPEVVEAGAGLLFAWGSPFGAIETADHLAYGLTSDAELEGSLSQSDLGMGKQKSAKVLVRYGGGSTHFGNLRTGTPYFQLRLSRPSSKSHSSFGYANSLRKPFSHSMTRPQISTWPITSTSAA